MSELSINLCWTRKEAELMPGEFSSEHEVTYNDKFKVTADTAPDWGGSALNTNPEQALAASLSSCHMMTFLALAAKTKWPLFSYNDQAIAHLGKNSKGQMIVNRIDLNPKVSFDSGFEISEAEMVKMHDRAHRYCFIANTLDGGVKVNINI
ncbi:MAG TPA: OsmC family peroxiredoxin [Candidatus Thioglobus sp.]|jgi:organic hydroperoxide reductase OsmC/OhrA|nr:OsmC family peroxiredoxin [Candidatus Thioglobus sp.]